MLLADAGAITAIRTGCASAVATAALAREDARVLAIFGTGVQARSHALAVSRVRRFDLLVLWGRDRDRAEVLKTDLAATLELDIEIVRDGQLAAARADVICTVTGASKPILLGDWVRPGTHVNVVGSSSLGPLRSTARSFAIALRRRLSAVSASCRGQITLARQAGLVTDDTSSRRLAKSCSAASRSAARPTRSRSTSRSATSSRTWLRRRACIARPPAEPDTSLGELEKRMHDRRMTVDQVAGRT